MSIWIMAAVVLAIGALAGWRQGGIMAAFATGGILFGTLLAGLIGKLFHFILPYLGVSDPFLALGLSPILGFILVSIIFVGIGFKVHRQVEVFYKHKSSELRLAMWERANTRLGIYLGILNGAGYFILLCVVIFNLTFWTVAVAGNSDQSFIVRITNQLGRDEESTGIVRAAAAIGRYSPNYYKLADVTALVLQNRDAASRLGTYPGLTSLWHRDDLQPLVTDSTITGAAGSGGSLNDILNEDPVKDLLKNKDLSKTVQDAVVTNLDDLTTYLQTGKSAKYSDKIIGSWKFNANVSVAWWRLAQEQDEPAKVAALRALWTKAYGSTVVLATGDHQLFIKSLPEFKVQQKSFSIDQEDWKGDWSSDDGITYTLDIKYNGEEKFLSGTISGDRMTVKDKQAVLIFDRVNN